MNVDPGLTIELGNVLASAGIARTVAASDELQHVVQTSLNRHRCGDWGEVDEHDRKANDDAAAMGYRLLSVYRLPSPIEADAGQRGRLLQTHLWIITESDRSTTTVLWPCEY